jgi:hypothetical protein
MNNAMIDSLESAYINGGTDALIDAACEAGTNHILVADLWTTAMKARFGGAGLHPSRCNADGTPSAETLAEFPRIAEVMTSAHKRIPEILAYMRARVAR